MTYHADRDTALLHLTQSNHPWASWCDGCRDIERIIKLDADVQAAARSVIAAGVSNRSGEKYAAKVRAFDALDDALEAFDYEESPGPG